MYRFSIAGEEWIVRFSPQVTFENEKKDAILRSINKVKKNLGSFTHGEAFLVEDQNLGYIVFKVEKVPSLILNVCNIIPEERCYFG